MTFKTLTWLEVKRLDTSEDFRELLRPSFHFDERKSALRKKYFETIFYERFWKKIIDNFIFIIDA